MILASILIIVSLALAIRSNTVIVATDRHHSCCSDVDHEDRFYRCALSSIAQSTDIRSSDNNGIVLISYSTENILDYSSYSFVINEIYALKHNYSLHNFNETSSNYCQFDQRWNKVKILAVALETWAINSNYIVWVDSDLVILNQYKSLHDIVINQYMYADIIISRDPNLDNGIANTGMMIVKNTQWSRQYLNKWWDDYDRGSGMDQHAFHQLYKSYDANAIANHITIVASDVINSNFPPWRHQTNRNDVLHMAGSSNILRKAVFKHGLESICRSNSSNYQSQIGLNRDTLFHYHNKFDRQKCLTDVSNAINLHVSSSNSADDVGFINSIRNQIRDILQLGNGEEDDVPDSIDSIKASSTVVCRRNGNSNYSMTLASLKWVYTSLRRIAVSSVDQFGASDNSFQCIQPLQDAIDACYDYVINDRDTTNRHEILLDVYDLLQTFISLVYLHSIDDTVRGKALYYKFKYYEFVMYTTTDTTNTSIDSVSGASSSKAANDLMSESEKAAVASIEVWRAMHALGWYGSGNSLFHPHREGIDLLAKAAVIFCSNKHYEQGLSYIKESLEYLHLLHDMHADGTADIASISLPISIVSSYIDKYIISYECSAYSSIDDRRQILKWMNLLRKYRSIGSGGSGGSGNVILQYEAIVSSIMNIKKVLVKKKIKK